MCSWHGVTYKIVYKGSIIIVFHNTKIFEAFVQWPTTLIDWQTLFDPHNFVPIIGC